MEAWGIGVFDNDAAVGWADRFDRSTPPARAAVVRSALQSVAGADDSGSAALAAAAVVASALPGGRLLPAGYGPKGLSENQFQVTPDLPGLALRALSKVRVPESAWSGQWREAGLLDDAVAVVDAVMDEIEERRDLGLERAS
ncbi:UNVERIFIED_CONTAM: uncharacterized protein DUF4259 [Williamsia faeni]